MSWSVRFCLLLGAILLSACTPKQVVVNLPEAENLHFTPDGRLIATGKGIFEIVKNNGVYQSVSLYNGDCGFAGMAQRGNWIYSTCASGPLWASKRYLLAAELKPNQTPQFQIIREIDLVIPNGMAFDPQGRLLLADENLLGVGKIVRIDIAQNNPTVVNSIMTWLDARHGVTHPNGIRMQGNDMFITDGGHVKVFQLNAQGDVISQRTLFSRVTVFDDLLPACGGAVVADYFAGTVLYVDRNGIKKYESTAQSFPGASSMQIGRGPLFDSYQLLITEKGMLLEGDSRIGDKLVSVRANFDLAQYAQDCPQ